MIDFVNFWSVKTNITVHQFVSWLGISAVKFNEWKKRYGKVNEHNNQIPRDNWLMEWEKKAILDFYALHLDEGYRRLSFMMLDEDIVAVSSSSVYRVLFDAGVMRKWDRKHSKKGTGFIQPLISHEHWHIDVSYINLRYVLLFVYHTGWIQQIYCTLKKFGSVLN
ncbi:hypothetical protein KKE26_01395 [bacterium]|nr:hypothetical protein [bacterium]MBU1754437.1 hypothetical protein [bacterium]